METINQSLIFTVRWTEDGIGISGVISTFTLWKCDGTSLEAIVTGASVPNSNADGLSFYMLSSGVDEKSLVIPVWTTTDERVDAKELASASYVRALSDENDLLSAPVGTGYAANTIGYILSQISRGVITATKPVYGRGRTRLYRGYTYSATTFQPIQFELDAAPASPPSSVKLQFKGLAISGTLVDKIFTANMTKSQSSSLNVGVGQSAVIIGTYSGDDTVLAEVVIDVIENPSLA